jgi:hypothetical protein
MTKVGEKDDKERKNVKCKIKNEKKLKNDS